jgi:hypothetical protein
LADAEESSHLDEYRYQYRYRMLQQPNRVETLSVLLKDILLQRQSRITEPIVGYIPQGGRGDAIDEDE